MCYTGAARAERVLRQRHDHEAATFILESRRLVGLSHLPSLSAVLSPAVPACACLLPASPASACRGALLFHVPHGFPRAVVRAGTDATFGWRAVKRFDESVPSRASTSHLPVDAATVGDTVNYDRLCLAWRRRRIPCYRQ